MMISQDLQKSHCTWVHIIPLTVLNGVKNGPCAIPHNTALNMYKNVLNRSHHCCATKTTPQPCKNQSSMCGGEIKIFHKPILMHGFTCEYVNDQKLPRVSFIEDFFFFFMKSGYKIESTWKRVLASGIFDASFTHSLK